MDISLKTLNRLLRPKEMVRVFFYAAILTIAIDRIRHGQFSFDDLLQLPSTLPISVIGAIVLVIVFWHLTIYELGILKLKDFVTAKLDIKNYRHWMNGLKRPKYCTHFNAEELYGYLKWECKDFQYPHRWATLVTPTQHALYLIPFAWLSTLIWVRRLDTIIIVAIIMIPISLITDISWERIVTATFIRQGDIVRRELKRYCDHQKN